MSGIFTVRAFATNENLRNSEGRMTLAIIVSLLCFLIGATGAAAVVAVANHFGGAFARTKTANSARID